MGFFSVRQKVSAEEYWRLRLSAIFCSTTLDQLAADAPPPLGDALIGTNRELAVREVQGVCICMASIAIAKLWPQRLALSASLTQVAIMNKECPDLVEVEHIYGSAFGSCSKDGVGPMVTLFLQRVFPEGAPLGLAEYLHEAFCDQLRARCRDWETMKLVQ